MPSSPSVQGSCSSVRILEVAPQQTLKGILCLRRSFDEDCRRKRVPVMEIFSTNVYFTLFLYIFALFLFILGSTLNQKFCGECFLHSVTFHPQAFI